MSASTSYQGKDSKIQLKEFQERYSRFLGNTWKREVAAKMNVKLVIPSSQSPLRLVQESLRTSFREWGREGELGNYVLRKAFEMGDGKMSKLVNSRYRLPALEDMVVLTNTNTMVDGSGAHTRTMVMVFEPKRKRGG